MLIVSHKINFRLCNDTIMAAKRKPESQIPSEESDQLLIRPLYVQSLKSLLIQAFSNSGFFMQTNYSDAKLIKMSYDFAMQCLVFYRIQYLHLIKIVYIVICVYCRGAGQEVGRSCIMLEFKGKKIMV